jgi:hypothetical protein
MWDKTDYDAPEHRTPEYQLFRLACLLILVGLLIAPTMFAVIPGVILIGVGVILGFAAILVWYFDQQRPHPRRYLNPDDDPQMDHAPYWTQPDQLNRRHPG